MRTYRRRAHWSQWIERHCSSHNVMMAEAWLAPDLRKPAPTVRNAEPVHHPGTCALLRCTLESLPHLNRFGLE
ncbi:hypothetical protein MPTK1_3g14760 [Marchantia polymorpha subsp. ruderalis]|uniref:Uncharacterized protein n=2 Tax=Marchantia polymorpha TaxID=3197 RepID=A0AAF6B0V8_MARPO|nr:hypothetical protein MARPO_0004s0195 [Marchantia polymorpha]PTQ48940.1 hypothetical protein MARPO_0004s0195 [Marchantia polymorpha]BBN05642.1 hypothetical protein Mp_3g14760 [Marchantia polymorpha subsp. ruderalis]BBN05643.1 hypothetical protein Mp_3g14760 [Marchantia polymorpha subsp. ruderalis]|eukprot:PTQ48939.1 hypothetical protein MARPO_0004s0195 [Marchantia polymorpha]